MFHLASKYTYFINIWFCLYNTLIRANLSERLNDAELHIFKLILLDVDESVAMCMINWTENKTN
jgi:hypothetical protein